MEEITTIEILSPPIKKFFDSTLLYNTLQRMKHRLETIIIPKSMKNIRPQDIGRRRKFDILIEQFKEVYEWQTAQENAYQEKVKAKTAKRPHIYAGKTMRFTRAL